MGIQILFGLLLGFGAFGVFIAYKNAEITREQNFNNKYMLKSKLEQTLLSSEHVPSDIIDRRLEVINNLYTLHIDGEDYVRVEDALPLMQQALEESEELVNQTLE